MGMLQNLTGWHAVIILAIVLLLFGAAKLPTLAKSIGQSMKIMKSELRDASADDAPRAADPTSTAVPVPTAAAPVRSDG